MLWSLTRVYPKRLDLSPDGRWIAYDNFAAEGKPERTIFLLAADGSAERRLVDAPGNYLFPMWSANGRRALPDLRPARPHPAARYYGVR